MAPKKNVTLNAMVKFFIQNYNIPTRKDVDKIVTRLDRIEKMVQTMNRAQSTRVPVGRRPPGQSRMTASDTVLDVIRTYKEGVGFAEIQKQTGFDDKKIRNIIFRLDKLGKIERISRGIYLAP